jgi:hypothetical protein
LGRLLLIHDDNSGEQMCVVAQKFAAENYNAGAGQRVGERGPREPKRVSSNSKVFSRTA